MKVRLLLVDDEPEFVQVLAERLRTRDFEVTTAGGAEQAFELVKRVEFDVVVLDVLMPGKDGIATLREIKQLKPILEVILLTGHATVETAVEGMKLGAFDYLMKPTEARILVEKILNAYKRKADQQSRIRQAEIDRIMLRRGWD